MVLQAQQSAEKALKAFLYSKGYTSIITHSIKELLRECEKIEAEFNELSGEARFLDMFYIPTKDTPMDWQVTLLQPSFMRRRMPKNA